MEDNNSNLLDNLLNKEVQGGHSLPRTALYVILVGLLVESKCEIFKLLITCSI